MTDIEKEKAKALILYRFEADPNPKVILGKVIDDTETKLTFMSGNGIKYNIEKLKDFFKITDTDIDLELNQVKRHNSAYSHA